MSARSRWLLALLLLTPSTAVAHEMRPALLELREVDEATLATLTWSYAHPDASPRLVLPARCPSEALARGPQRLTQRVDCPLEELLAGARLALNAFTPDAVVRVHRRSGTRTVVVGRDHPDLAVAATSDAPPSFLRLGVEHILGGVDHLLFVLGLLLIALPGAVGGTGTVRRLATAITAFTAAHSVTLGLSVLDLVRLPPAGVEAAIAASLVLLAIEATHERETFTRRHPAAVAFAFGLLHGFGFAGALREVGLPEEGLAAALFTFNVGVELGQLAFLGASLSVLAVTRRFVPRRLWFGAGVYAVGGLGMFWLLQRSAAVVAGGLS